MSCTHKFKGRPCRILREYDNTALVAVEYEMTAEERAQYAPPIGTAYALFWSIVPRSELTPL